MAFILLDTFCNHTVNLCKRHINIEIFSCHYNVTNQTVSFDMFFFFLILSILEQEGIKYTKKVKIFLYKLKDKENNKC